MRVSRYAHSDAGLPYAHSDVSLRSEVRLASCGRSFLVPVASAFGEYDGKQRLGMLRRSEYDVLTRVRPRNPRDASNFSNSRGDVQSRTAALQSALAVRLYVLAEFVLQENLSTASWPGGSPPLL